MIVNVLCRLPCPGTPIGKSPSPVMHNTAFHRIGLPWTYGLFDSEDVGAFAAEALAAPDFGGCSVTIPHKKVRWRGHTSLAATAVGKQKPYLLA